jgi:hypothetical protein
MMGIKIHEFAPLPRESLLEELVPSDCFYRDLEECLDLSFVREMVAPRYTTRDVLRGSQKRAPAHGSGSRPPLAEMVPRLRSLRVCARSLQPHQDQGPLRARRVFRRFFEQIVERCADAGLVWGEEFYFDATKIEGNASLGSIRPRLAVEQHLQNLFEGDSQEDPDGAPGGTARATANEDLDPLPTSQNVELISANAAKSDWISKAGRQDREVKGSFYRRKADLFLSKTDPDSSPMKRKGADHSHLGYQAHCVVDGGKARIILGALAAPFEVTENKPMLDMLWRAAFRRKCWPRRVTGYSAFGTVENVAAIERASVRAYVALKGAGQGRPFFGKDEFLYDPERDHYTCPSGEILLPQMRNVARSLIGYRAESGTCDTCPLRSDGTTSKLGRQILRHFDEEYVDRVEAYRGTFLYEKAVRKRRVWVEPLFAEAKDWHGMRRVRLRSLEKVNIEALLIASGQNVKRLLTLGAGDRRSWLRR